MAVATLVVSVISTVEVTNVVLSPASRLNELAIRPSWSSVSEMSCTGSPLGLVTV